MKWALGRLRLIVAAVTVATIAALPARGDYLTFDITSHEAMADYTGFESRSWSEGELGEGGRLSENAVWSGGERIILSDLYIPSGVTLTINAGTVVRFREGTRIKVEDGGNLIINGEAGNEVVLQGYDEDANFTGIVLQSSSASYSDNSHVIVQGFSFGKYATVSLSDATAFVYGGWTLVPVTVTGSRNTSFSFDWVAETNGVQFASGTMSWNRVSEGTKNITVPYPEGLPGCSNFVVRAVTLRCCQAGRAQCEVELSEFSALDVDIASHEGVSEYIAFESRDWAEGLEGDGGRLSSNVVWSGAHKIVSDVYIPSGVTLTLSAGTVVEFCEGTRIKIEDGGTLNVVGSEGHDVIFRGADGVSNFVGIVKMANGTFADNGYVQAFGFTHGTFANVALHDSETSRLSGFVVIPITVSGSRSQSFSIDWVAETNDVAYQTGTLSWGSVSEGTKNLAIYFGDELDPYTNLTLRVTASRACYSSPSVCTIKIVDFADFEMHDADLASHEAMSDYIAFETRGWAEGIDGDGGRLADNTVWSGPHKIVSDVYIPSGVTLTLSADTVVEFCEGTRIKIEDGGALNIVGAEGHDVIFRAAEGVTNFVGIVKMSSGSYTDNMYVQYLDKPYASYPNITLNEATTYRGSGTLYMPVTIGGTSRSKSFNIDWRTDKGDVGTVTWNSSSDGTKWIQIPIDTTPVGGTTNHIVEITAARACNISVGRVALTIIEPDYIVDGMVALSESDEDSGEFAVNGDIKTQPLFLNPVETVQYSGKWQPYDADEAAALRVTLETDNGSTVLKEVSPDETGAFDLRLADYPVGCYTLKHEIVNDLGETLATMQKTFSIADEEDVVMHGGTLTQNEVWAADKVHVVYETVVVPSIYTIFIEPGAIVKFMTGTGIDISQGGAFFANKIVFTHINDDTIGGDTLSDGYTVAPPMDAYFLSGAFTFGDDTELRGITQNTALAGTISTQKTLSRGSTYRVSGTVTIASGASLTIPPGTVLKMESGAAIVVNSGATLNAIGTRAAPIVITSIKDDDYSGDTNNDGSATYPQPGDWEEIKNNGGTMNLAFVSALYGGYGQYSNQGDAIIRTAGGETTMECCEVKHSNLRLVGRTGGTVYAQNCILEDGRWGIDGTVTFVNGVIAYCNTGANGASLKNSILWDCDVYASGGTVSNCVAYGETATVQSGMIFEDPLFIDAENGDFRIREGSPCVDAANSAVAPELDYYGQPRITITETGDELVGQLADIGICEVMPRDIVSDIDLVPQSVRTTTNAVPGQLLFVKWEIANVGGSEVDGDWNDTISLVSETGREVTLGDKRTVSRIAVGGSVFCSGYFTVPAISEGVWYPKVNVNSYHDIFEGSLANNNALVGDRAVIVGMESLDPQVSREGVINAGSPTILKLAFDEVDENRMVKLDLPTGVKVTWGFGFMPQGVSKSGSMVAAGDGVMFKVPDDATEVYVVLESDTTTTYNLFTEPAQMVITGVTPATLPSSGITTLTIAGAGFGDENTVTLLSSAGSYQVPAIATDDFGNLIATVDCAALKAGVTYIVKVATGEKEADLENAVKVVKAVGNGVLEARLVVPDSARQQRVSVGYVEYENVGDGDMPAPVFIVSSKSKSAKDMVFSFAPDAAAMSASIRIVGIGSVYPKGVLRHGDRRRIPFYYKVVGDSYSITLSVVDETSDLIRKSVYPTWRDFCIGISEAATRVNGIDGDTPNYDVIYANSMRKAYGQCVGVIHGRLIDIISSEPMAGENLYIVDTNLTVWANTTTDANGMFRFDDLQYGLSYRIGSYTCQADSTEIFCSEDSLVDETLYGAPFAKIKIVVDGLPQELMNDEDTLIALYDNNANEAIYCTQQNGCFEASGLLDGTYSVLGMTTGMYCLSDTPQISINAGRIVDDTVHVEFVPAGLVNIFAFDTRTGLAVSSTNFQLVNEDGAGFAAVLDDNGTTTLKLPPGEYKFVQAQEFAVSSSEPLVVVAGVQTNASIEVSITPFSVIPSMGACDLVSVFAVSVEATNGVTTVEWDFDNDGIYDATGFVATNIYTTAGLFDVKLRLTNVDGSTQEYLRKEAVETWTNSEFVLSDGSIILDEYAGYTVLQHETDYLMLELNWQYLPLALDVGTVVVLPDDILKPLCITNIEIIDASIAKIYVQEARLEKAFRSLRTSISASSSGRKTKLDDVNYSGSGTLFHFSYDSSSDSDSKAKKFNKEAGGGVAIDALVKGDVCVIIANSSLEKVSWAWDVSATLKLSGSASISGRTNKKNIYRRNKPSFETTVWNSNLVIGVVPVNFNVVAYCEAGLEGSISWSTGFRSEYMWNRSVGFRHPTSSPGLDNFYPQFAGTASASVGIKCSGSVGVAKSFGKSEWGAKLFEAGLSIGYKAELNLVLDANPENPDSISFNMGPEIKGSIELIKASFGPFWSGSLASWESELKLTGFASVNGSWQTPMPTFALDISEWNKESYDVTVSGTSTTKYNKETTSLSTWSWRWDGAMSAVGNRATYKVYPKDKVDYYAILSEQYNYVVQNDWFRWLENYNGFWGVKQGRCKFTLIGGDTDEDEPELEQDKMDGNIPQSYDPNEMSGPLGQGDTETERFVKPGDVLTYTVYFENKSDATAAAQEVYVTNPLSEYLDWSTFEMGEIAFNNQIDLGLSGKPYGTSEATMNGTNFLVRTKLGGGADGTGEIASQGVAHWYMRIVDPTTGTGWPEDITAGFLPPNDETFRGEGHLTYRIKVRDDAPQNVVITNSATIVFDYNDPIETDPAWWNTVAPTIGTAQFAEQDVVEDEGSNIVVRVKGGNLYTDSSVKLYLSYNTAAAADLDLAKGAIDGVTPKGGLKFPLALSWEAGELGEKVITIPVKADKAVEDDEFFTLQLGAPVGMELGDATICTVTIHDPGYAKLRDRINAGTATKAESNTWAKVSHEGIHYIRGLADPANAGKVTGSGYCADGKKVTLKATANKGFVFMDWCDAAGSRVATNATLVVDRTAKPAASTATTTTLTDVDDDTTYYAKFITVEEDRASIMLKLLGEDLDSPSVAPTALVTNVTCGVALEWPLASYALSTTTVKVTGLPAGLKFAAKDVLDSKTKQVIVKANTIYGAPTAASKVDAKKGVVPSDVKITVTTAGKSSVTYLVKLTVDPLPAWAVGTFDGEVEDGGIVQAFTVATSGKISGKVLEGGMTWALSAPNFSRAEYAEGGPEPEVPSPSFFATVIGKAGKEVVTNEVEVAGSVVEGVEVGVASSDGWSAWQNLWSRPDTKAEMPVFRKSFDVEYGDPDDRDNMVKFTFKNGGAVSFAGKVEGVGVSGSSQLVCGDNGWQVTLYAPPKGAFKGFSETFAVILTFDEANAVTDVEVAEWQ